MGQELHLQAIPENCEILQRAKEDIDIAEWLLSLQDVMEEKEYYPTYKDPNSVWSINAVIEIMKENHDIQSRYFYDMGRMYDAIEYLLCRKRRHRNTFLPNESMIHVAIYGNETINPEWKGFNLGLITCDFVSKIVDYMSEITFANFKQFWHPATMSEFGVYKVGPSMDERVLVFCWDEFQKMYNLYQQAQNHGEAVIATIY